MPVRRADAVAAIGLTGGERPADRQRGYFLSSGGGPRGTCHGPLSDLVVTWRVAFHSAGATPAWQSAIAVITPFRVLCRACPFFGPFLAF